MRQIGFDILKTIGITGILLYGITGLISAGSMPIEFMILLGVLWAFLAVRKIEMFKNDREQTKIMPNQTNIKSIIKKSIFAGVLSLFVLLIMIGVLRISFTVAWDTNSDGVFLPVWVLLWHCLFFLLFVKKHGFFSFRFSFL